MEGTGKVIDDMTEVSTCPCVAPGDDVTTEVVEGGWFPKGTGCGDTVVGGISDMVVDTSPGDLTFAR